MRYFVAKFIQSIKEKIRQYRAIRSFKRLARKGQALAKKKGLKPEDFGGPFED